MGIKRMISNRILHLSTTGGSGSDSGGIFPEGVKFEVEAKVFMYETQVSGALIAYVNVTQFDAEGLALGSGRSGLESSYTQNTKEAFHWLDYNWKAL